MQCASHLLDIATRLSVVHILPCASLLMVRYSVQSQRLHQISAATSAFPTIPAAVAVAITVAAAFGYAAVSVVLLVVTTAFAHAAALIAASCFSNATACGDGVAAAAVASAPMSARNVRERLKAPTDGKRCACNASTIA